MSRKSVKLLFAGIWGLGFCVAVVYWRESGLEFSQVPEALEAWLSRFGLVRAAAIYVVLYTLRPLILFPATALTVASGLLFGPWLGILFTVIGENASANFAFLIGRWLGGELIEEQDTGWLRRWDRKIRENALTSVMLMRLILLPFDAVNYGCGLTSMRQRDFAIGTFLGIIPALVAFVLLGGAGSAGVENRILLLAIAGFVFLLGLIVASRLRRISPENAEPDANIAD
ncbi:MAG: TVP38/TMEM64 family protein [Myxococcota bacterium]